METLLIAFLAVLADPIRWIICILSAWFIRNYIGALAAGIGITVGLTAMLVRNPNGPLLFIGAIASAIIVSIFYFWRKSRREKLAKESA